MSQDEELNSDSAYNQATMALDIATEQAVQCGDRETLTTVVALWIKIAENLSP